MRDSQRLQSEAALALEAELSRDKAAIHASIDNFTDMLATLREAYEEDLKHADQAAAVRKAGATRRFEVLRAHIEQRIEADKARLRDLDGIKVEEKPEEKTGEQQEPAPKVRAVK